jgi:hypothetical protein
MMAMMMTSLSLFWSRNVKNTVFLGLVCISLVLGSRSSLDPSPLLDILASEIDRANDVTALGRHDESMLDRSDDFYFDEDMLPSTYSVPYISNSTALQATDDFYFDEDMPKSTYSAPYILDSTALEATKDSSIASAIERMSSFRKLFSPFSWKGFGFVIEKSIFRWQTFGFGFKVPVTSNFPVYSQLRYLPKVGTTFALTYPYGCKFSLSASYTLGTAVYGEYYCQP